ncbi:helix-turn-helix transcriptional regulator [Cupriavidus sp. CuC1]|uniref:helix-turn-helix transcriptional regulator n=1 Tax=Cupriavidus sp. CuC1 TaxID=3373131 RepID=UPI0037D443B9
MDRNQVAASAPPGLYRIAAAAALVGISPDLLESAIKRGEAPLTLLRLGSRRMLFVRAVELHAWLQGVAAVNSNAPAADQPAHEDGLA